MSFSLRPTRTSIGAVVLALLVAGCPSEPELDPTVEDGGTPEGGPTADGQAGDGATKDSGPPAPACGRLTTACKDGEKCEGAPDCASKICRDNICQTAAPADNTKNGDETDVDCGGSKAPACANGKGCLVGQDCSSSVCKAGVCQAPSPTDGVKNGDETGKDCGGAVAPKCPAGEGCLSNDDCDKVKCDTVQKKCLPASHSDGIKNLDETGIDCGGPTPAVARCAPGQGCVDSTDCANVACNPGTLVCDPPSSTDGFKNGTETDVDCGGGAPTNAGPCGAGLACLVNADCTSTGCNHAKKCAQARSCVAQMGGTTCGKGEVGQAGAAHEDCCTSVLLPNGAARVDKYEITAGRMREFIRVVGNDVQTWVVNNRGITQQIADNMVQYLPTGLKTPVHPMTQCDSAGGNCAATNQQFGILQHLGNNVFMPDRPCPNCGQGCYIGAAVGGNGHPTYWWDNVTQGNEFGSLNRATTQAQLDVKSLNCTPQLLFAAFCAWDGGRLPTQQELGSTTGAWGPSTYPWGNTPAYTDTLPGAAGRVAYAFAASSFVVPMYDADGTYHPEAATLNSTNWNPFPSSPAVFQARHVWPLPIVSALNPQGPGTNDQAYAVASPGRMRNDFRFIGPGADDGFYDVSGNLIEATGTIPGNDNATHNTWPVSRWVGGSFEGHDANVRGGYDLSVLTKYGKQGARCARAP